MFSNDGESLSKEYAKCGVGNIVFRSVLVYVSVPFE